MKKVDYLLKGYVLGHDNNAKGLTEAVENVKSDEVNLCEECVHSKGGNCGVAAAGYTPRMLGMSTLVLSCSNYKK